jgi:transglutaminase-like putative cysteine protease
MCLERLLQINMATLAALGALLLGMGQRSEGPPLLVALAAVVSVWLTDVTRRFCLSWRVSNLLMLLAAAVVLPGLFHLRSELQAIDFAWLLIYLQIILLFQRKNERTYWLLVMLSLLQVVVATLFSQGIGFGALLVVYMLLGFSAMTLLMMYRQWDRYRPSAEGAGIGGQGPVGRRRWPLGMGRHAFTSLPAGSGQTGIGGALFRRLGRMGLQTLSLAMVLFFAVPRFGQFAYRGEIAPPQTLVGFTDKVTLGELGQIIESREEVMRVRFCGISGDTPVPVHGDIYLQGALMMIYRHGQWQTGQPCGNIGIQPWLDRGERRLPQSDLVRQKFAIERLDRNELFYVAPYIPLKNNSDIEVDLARLRLLRVDDRRLRRFEYVLGTTAIVDGRQKPLTPAEADTVSGRDWPNDLTDDTLDMPQGKDSLPKLTALAKRWIDESKLPKEDRLGRARYLERMLAAGTFRYSLTGPDRNPNLDPIEDFVAKHRVGHCEYFATALTLMLRSQGIRARLVSGYKCDGSDWNSLGGYYQVRQLDAHTWVEAYLSPKQIQLHPDLTHGNGYWQWKRLGGWLRLDPTPAGAANEKANLFTPTRRGLDWIETAWSKYVVELDCQSQRDAIYRPIANAAQAVWREATSPERWSATFNSLTVALYLDRLSREARWALLGVVGLVALALLACLGWLFWRIGRRLGAHWTGSRPRRAAGRRVEIEFYRRFENLLARQGLIRAPAQTQREFAAAAGARLAAVTGENRVAALPAVVAEAFYHVRFGRAPLDNLQTQAVEQALQELLKIGKSSAGRPHRKA